MNTFPMFKGKQVRNDGCGRIGNENRERYFWQSRMTRAGDRAEPIEVVNIAELATSIRKGWH